MDYLSFFESFFQGSPQHIRLFEILKAAAADNPDCLSEAYLVNTFYILENMHPIFVDRRSDDFFSFLIKKLSHSQNPTEDEPICEVTPFCHSIAFPFQCKSVVGFFLCLSGIQIHTEALINTFCAHYKGISLVKNSTLLIIKPHKNRTLLYFELQKEEGEFFPDEVQDLQDDLKERGLCMLLSWKVPIPSLESSIKTLRWLMKELEKEDLPHVMIVLGPQTPVKLHFFAFVCHFVNRKKTVLTDLLRYPNVEVECSFQDKVKGGSKEGIALKIAIPNSPSSFVEKRQQISRLIEECVGPFRDVNGGLLEKIEENFESLSKISPDDNKGLREFFDSIYPESARAVCSPDLLRAIYSATQKEERYALLEEANAIAAVVKVEKDFVKSWKETLSKQFPKAGFSETLVSNKATLSCFLNHPSQEEIELFKSKTEALFEEWMQKETCQTLRLCATVPFNSFDPRTGAEEETSYLHKMLFEGLMRIGPSGKPDPAIAKKVTISKDKTRYTFHLRKSRWSNRMPLTAHDFLYSWNMILAKKELAPLSYLFDRIENAEEVKRREMPPKALGVNAIDDYTLEVRLRSPCTAFLEMCALTLFSPICQTVDKKHPSWAEAQGKEYVCNGPFCLEEKKDNGGIVLKKNPFYWESEKTRLEKVTIPVVSQEEGKRLFLDKQVDALLYYFYKDSSFLDIGDLEATRLKGSTGKRFLSFNCLKPPFHNKKVRKAIALALNRKRILQNFPKGTRPSFSFYSSFYSQNNRKISALQNIQKARKLLIQALAEDPEVRKTFFNQTIFALEVNKSLAAATCSYLNKALGLDWNVSISKMGSRGYCKEKENLRVSIFGWADRTHEPGYFLGIFSSKESFPNISCWTHPSMQAIIEKAKTTKNREEEQQILQDAEKILFEEMPIVPLLDAEYTSLCHPYVQGIYANFLHQFDIRFAFKSQQSILKN